MKRIVIIDYGLGNLRSVFKALEKAGAKPCITAKDGEISSADGIVLPGVGAFHEGMEQLGVLQKTVLDATKEIPLLGICLGMQMLLNTSEEHGLHEGLGLIPGTVKRFPKVSGYKIPHMGWNSIRINKANNPLFEGFDQEEYVYFVHSFYAETDVDYTLSTTNYIRSFASVIQKDYAYGVQFHPEKSGNIGLTLLKNFIGLL